MLTWLRYLDRVIRGEATRPAALRNGEIEQPVGGLAVLGIILGAIYGICMGCYALFQGGHAPVLQVFATTLKVPILFFFTLAVTFPSLYVFNALVGSRLSVLSVLRLLVISLIVMLTVLASLGPIVAFFAASTTSYPFMLLLNVLIFTIAGFLGLRYMLMTLHRLSLAIVDSIPVSASTPTQLVTPSSPPLIDMPGSFGTSEPAPSAATAPPLLNPNAPAPPPSAPAYAPTPPKTPPSALDNTAGSLISKDVRTVFRVWIVVFGLVGAQMAWVLRPFLGSPQHVFSWFRPRESNFFEALLYALTHLFR